MIQAAYAFDAKLNLHTMMVVWAEVAGIFVDQDEPKKATMLFKSGHSIRLNMGQDGVRSIQDSFAKYLEGGK